MIMSVSARLPLVSVVTPSLNNAAFIERTIRSVLAQDYPHIEHIVVDGGSSDGTVAILERYPHLRWTSEPDRGQAAAINKGFALARGEILAWLNSDDLYLPGAISEAVAALAAHPDCSAVYSDFVVIDERGVELARFPSLDFDLDQEINAGNFVPQPTAFFRREALERVGWLDERYRYAMDYDLFIRVGKRSRLLHAERYWAAFRLRPESKTVSQSRRFWREEREISRRHGGRFFSELWITHHARRWQRMERLLPELKLLAALIRRRRFGVLAGKVARRLLRRPAPAG